MENNFLQAGFEIKLACDALSRRILRWHWEKSPRPNSLKELLQYVAQRSVEAPDYYANMATRTGNVTWQQLDTTFCVRVLLDSEAGAKKPRRLLQYAVQENAARRACNGLRIARNAAAHATDKAGVVKAIAIFDETLADLEHAYGLVLFAANELEEYDALIARATVACGAKQKQTNKSAAKPSQSTTKKQVSAATTRKKTATPTKAKQTVQTNVKRTTAKPSQSKQKAHGTSREKAFACLALIVFLAALCVQLLK